jgi:hypothetical protein
MPAQTRATARMDTPPDRIPEYVPRDLDPALDEALARGGLILIVGESTAGKSRAAYQSMYRLARNRRFGIRWLLVPVAVHPKGLRELLDQGLVLRNTVVWLDDLDRYLGIDGLDVELLDRLVGDPRRRVRVLATMRRGEYLDRTRDQTILGQEYPHGGARHEVARNLLRAQRDLLGQATRIELDRKASDTERHRALRSSDPRIIAALAHSSQFGLAEYLAASPALWQTWQDAQAIENLNEHPERLVGAAIVAAAIDCRRSGLRRPVPESLLKKLHYCYLEAAVGARLRPDCFPSGLSWATQLVQATTALLTPTPDGYVVSDYLLDQVQATRDAQPVQPQVWAELLAVVKPQDAWSVAVAGYLADQEDVAIHAIQIGIQATYHTIATLAAVGLGKLLSQAENPQ